MRNYKDKSINEIKAYIKENPNLQEDTLTELLAHINYLKVKNTDFIEKLLRSDIYNTACTKLKEIGQAESITILGEKHDYFPINKVFVSMYALASTQHGTGGTRDINKIKLLLD